MFESENNIEDFIREVETYGKCLYCCGLCTSMFSLQSALSQHISDIHRRPDTRLLATQDNVPNLQSESPVTDTSLDDEIFMMPVNASTNQTNDDTMQGIDEDRKPDKRLLAAQVNVPDLQSESPVTDTSLDDDIFMMPVNASTNQTNDDTMQVIDEDRKPDKRLLAAQVNVPDLKLESPVTDTSLDDEIFMMPVNASTNQTNDDTMQRIDEDRKPDKRLLAAQVNVPDLKLESPVTDTSLDDEIFMMPVNASTNQTNDDTMQRIDEDRKPDKRLLAAQVNVPDLQSESPVTDTSLDDDIFMMPVNASTNQTNDDTMQGIDEDRKPDKRLLAAQVNVPDLKLESPVTDTSLDDEIFMMPVNASTNQTNDDTMQRIDEDRKPDKRLLAAQVNVPDLKLESPVTDTSLDDEIFMMPVNASTNQTNDDTMQRIDEDRKPDKRLLAAQVNVPDLQSESPVTDTSLDDDIFMMPVNASTNQTNDDTMQGIDEDRKPDKRLLAAQVNVPDLQSESPVTDTSLDDEIFMMPVNASTNQTNDDTMQGIDEDRKPDKRLLAAQVNVPDLKLESPVTDTSLDDEIFMMPVNASTNQTNDDTMQRIDEDRKPDKRLLAAQVNVPDLKLESPVTDTSLDDEIFMMPVNASTNQTNDDTMQRIDEDRKPDKRLLAAQVNVPDLQSESPVTDTSLDDDIFMMPVNASTNQTNDDTMQGIDEDRKPDERLLAAQVNVPDLQSESPVTDTSLDDEIFMMPVNASTNQTNDDTMQGIDEDRKPDKRLLAAQVNVPDSQSESSVTDTSLDDEIFMMTVNASTNQTNDDTMQRIDEDRKPDERLLAAQVNVPDLQSESPVTDTSLDDEIFMMPVNASTNQTNDDTMQGIDEDRKPDKRLLAAQVNVPDSQSESSVTDTSLDDEIFMMTVNASTNQTNDDTMQRIDEDRKPDKRLLAAQVNVPDLQSESPVTDTSLDDDIFMMPVNASTNQTNDDTMQGIDEDRKPDERLLAAQVNVPDLQSESPVTDTSLDDEIFMMPVNASTNQTNDDTMQRIDEDRKPDKRLLAAQVNVPDLKLESPVTDTSLDDEIFMMPVNASTNQTNDDTMQRIDEDRKPDKRLLAAQVNVPDLQSESPVTDTSLDDDIFMMPVNASTNQTNDDTMLGIDEDRKPDKRLLAAQVNVPDLQSESPVTDTSLDDDIFMMPVNASTNQTNDDTMQGIDEDRKPDKRLLAAQVNVPDLKLESPVTDTSLDDEIFMMPVNASTNQTNDDTMQGIDEDRKPDKRLLAAQVNVPDLKLESPVTDTSLDDEIFMMPVNASTNQTNDDTMQGIDEDRKPDKRLLAAQVNVPDSQSESSVTDTSLDDEIFMMPVNASTDQTNDETMQGIDENRRPYKRQVAAQDNVPHKRVRYSCDLCTSTFSFRCNLSRHKTSIHGVFSNNLPYKRRVADQDNVPYERVRYSCDLCISTFSYRFNLLRHLRNIHGMDANNLPYLKQVPAQDNVPHKRVRHSCDLCTSTFRLQDVLLQHKKNSHGIDGNHRRSKSRVAVQDNVPDIRSQSSVNALYNLRPRNSLRVVHQNEYLHKGNKNQSFSTPKKRYSLRKLYEDYLDVNKSQDRMLAFASHAGSLSQKLNLELKVIEMLMSDIQTDYSTPIDENLIQMLHQDSLFCMEYIQHHTQYYIFVQLVYGLMKIYEINFEDLRSHRKSMWMKNTIAILKYFKFNDDTVDFMIERMENFI